MASSNGLKQDLGVVQGVGLLSTSLLGTGGFAVPAIVAQLSGNDSLWAWLLLIVLVFPIAIGFAALGQHFPNAGGPAHFVNLEFGPRLALVTRRLFLSVIPLGLPADLLAVTAIIDVDRLPQRYFCSGLSAVHALAVLWWGLPHKS